MYHRTRKSVGQRQWVTLKKHIPSSLYSVLYCENNGFEAFNTWSRLQYLRVVDLAPLSFLLSTLTKSFTRYFTLNSEKHQFTSKIYKCLAIVLLPLLIWKEKCFHLWPKIKCFSNNKNPYLTCIKATISCWNLNDGSFRNWFIFLFRKWCDTATFSSQFKNH